MSAPTVESAPPRAAAAPLPAAAASPTAPPWDTDGDVVWSGHGAGPGICQTIESPAGAHFAPVQNEAERHANARLIAAAPELLAALREIADDHCECEGPNEATEFRGRVCQFHAAIAKAEGQS